MDESPWWPSGIVTEDSQEISLGRIQTVFGTLETWDYQECLAANWWQKLPREGTIWGQWPEVSGIQILHQDRKGYLLRINETQIAKAEPGQSQMEQDKEAKVQAEEDAKTPGDERIDELLPDADNAHEITEDEKSAKWRPPEAESNVNTDKVGVGPFERFQLGGDGLTGQNFLMGTDVVGLRGYENNSITPVDDEGIRGGTIFSKYVMELRYPVSLNPSATIYFQGFFEAGNNIIIADIGHYESEQFTKGLIYNLLNKKFTKFAIQLSKINTNPIKYL